MVSVPYPLSSLWVIKRSAILSLEGNIGNLKKEVSKSGYTCIRNKTKSFSDDMVTCFNILSKEDKFQLVRLFDLSTVLFLFEHSYTKCCIDFP